MLRGVGRGRPVLRRGGRLAVFWNVFQLPAELGAVFSAVYRQVAPGLPFDPWAKLGIEDYSAIFDKAASGIRAVGAFGSPERWQLDWELPYTTAGWLEQVPTMGGHDQVPPDQLDQLLAGMGAAIDAIGGGFRMCYAAVALSAPRHSPA